MNTGISAPIGSIFRRFLTLDAAGQALWPRPWLRFNISAANEAARFRPAHFFTACLHVCPSRDDSNFSNVRPTQQGTSAINTR
ncbi:MAG TPA: hypothetical protein VHV55_12010, partial [Pirellulales bacterium]|nr:hypothetical protein [Pirellulales bacterium]